MQKKRDPNMLIYIYKTFISSSSHLHFASICNSYSDDRNIQMSQIDRRENQNIDQESFVRLN